MALLIQGGEVVTAEGRCRADVYCEGEQVTSIGPALAVPRGTPTVDARGKYVFPGFVDPHVHVYLPFMGTQTRDTYETASRAALLGGTTCYLDFISPTRQEDPRAGIEAWFARAGGRSACDYSFHMTVSRFDEQTPAMLRALVGRGITSCKVYLAYEGLALSDRELFRTLRAARELGLTVVGHCENQGLIEELQRQLLAEGKTGPAWHYWSRPPFVEAAGVHHLCAFSQAHGAGLYIAHTTCRAALEEATRARERGVPVAVETCIQYLLLDKSYAERPDFEGAKYVVSPPLRGPEDRDALWAGLSGGAVATVATDHAPTDFASQKSLGRGDFTKIPGGVPGIQDRVRLLFTHGVAAGRLSLERFVQVAATRPAELFGLYPRKGTLRAGSDADVVVFDPRPESVISAQTHAMNVDYSAYEGWRVKGSFDLVTVRGAVAVQEGRFVGRADRGQFVPRQAVAS